MPDTGNETSQNLTNNGTPNNTLETANSISGNTGVRPHSVKLPPFNPESPELFFLLSEATLKTAGITNPEQIFLYILIELPSKVQLNCKHLIAEQSSDKLQKLRNIVDHLYNRSPEKRLKKLLNTTSLGDMRPSEYLRYIRELQGEDVDSNSALIRTFFIQSLPKNIAPLVTLMSESSDLDTIAKAADKCVAFCSSGPKPNTVASMENTSIDLKLDLLTEQINSMKFKNPNTPNLDTLNREFNEFKTRVESKLT